MPVPEAAAEGPKAAEGEKPAKGSPASKPEKTPEPKMRRRIGVRHLGYAAGGAFFLWPVVGGWVPTVLTTAPAVWVVAALIAGQQGDDDQELAEDGEEHDTEEDEGGDPVTALVVHVLEALAAAEVHPDPKLRKGVHVRDLITSADTAGLLRGPTTPGQMRTWLGLHGIPTKHSLALPSGTTYGVRVEDVVAVLGRPLRQALVEGFRLPLGGASEAAPEGGPAEASEQVGGEPHPTPAAPPSPTLASPAAPAPEPAPSVAHIAAGVVALSALSPTDSSDRSRRA
ncbi:hypothetical protein [Streptomyces lavendulae]|uniref:hypothetical protein n=1 Tax=Streptomyces lavendulae TaxID=1914 RepID=UPI0031EDF3E2